MLSTTEITIILSAIGIIITLITAALRLSWVLSIKFEEIRKEFWLALNTASDKIIDKLEYHETHDDTRFETNERRHQATSDRIWNIELRNAAKDGVLPREYPIYKKD